MTKMTATYPETALHLDARPTGQRVQKGLPAQVSGPGLRELLFSAQGRISRSQLWRAILIILAAAVSVGLLFVLLWQVIPGEVDGGEFRVNGLTALPYLALAFGYIGFSIWSGLCIGIKRFHDRNKSGAWVLIQLVPFVGPLWYLVEVGFLRGTAGPNRYGPDPLGLPKFSHGHSAPQPYQGQQPAIQPL